MATPHQLFAEQICFQETAARKLVVELAVCDQVKKDILTFNTENNLLKTKSSLCEQSLDLTLKDKEEFKTQAMLFKDQLITKQKDLEEARASKPSRLTWFGIGAGTATVVGIILGFLVAR